MKQRLLFPGEEHWWNETFLATLAERLPAGMLLETGDVAEAMHVSNAIVNKKCEGGELLALNLEKEGSRAVWRIFKPSVFAHYRANMDMQPLDIYAAFDAWAASALPGGTYASTAQVAELFHCCPELVCRLCADGFLPAIDLNKTTDRRAFWKILRVGVFETIRRQLGLVEA